MSKLRNEQEVRRLLEDLRNNPDPDDDEGYRRIKNDPNWEYLCAVCDTLDWIVGEVETEDFLSDAFLDIKQLRAKAQAKD